MQKAPVFWTDALCTDCWKMAYKKRHISVTLYAPEISFVLHHNYDGFSKKHAKYPTGHKEKTWQSDNYPLNYRRNSDGFAELFSAKPKTILAQGPVDSHDCFSANSIFILLCCIPPNNSLAWERSLFSNFPKYFKSQAACNLTERFMPSDIENKEKPEVLLRHLRLSQIHYIMSRGWHQVLFG